MKARLLAGACALAVCGSVFSVPAAARDQGNIGTVGPDNPVLELTGTPLAGVFPGTVAPSQPFALFRPPACRAATYCDAVEFDVTYPEHYLREIFFGVRITLSWDNPYHHEHNPTGNDLDLFLWGDDGPATGGPSSKCQRPSDPDCDNIHPEVITMTDPSDTTAEDAEPPAIFLTIVNDKGVNTGYELTVEWFTFDLPDPPRFVPPARETTAAPIVAGPFDLEVTASQGGLPGPEPTPRKILVPGPDGELHEIELPFFAAGQRVAEPAGGSDTAKWVTAGIAGGVALAASTVLLIRRSRRLRDQL